MGNDLEDKFVEICVYFLHAQGLKIKRLSHGRGYEKRLRVKAQMLGKKITI